LKRALPKKEKSIKVVQVPLLTLLRDLQKMIKVFYFLVLMHFFTDFVAQGKTISIKKQRLNKYMFTHVIITTLGAAVVLSFYLSLGHLLIATFIKFSSHLVIDIFKKEITNRFPDQQWKFLGLDQMAHASILYLISTVFIQ
jgi:hypothetical protein